MTRRRAEPLHRPPQLPLPPHLLQKMDHPSPRHHHPQLRPPRPHLRRRPPPTRPWLPNKPRPITRHMGPPLPHTPPRHPFSLLPPLNRTPLHSPFHPTRHRRNRLRRLQLQVPLRGRLPILGPSLRGQSIWAHGPARLQGPM